jgi:hypothetical protein
MKKPAEAGFDVAQRKQVALPELITERGTPAG